MGDYVPLLSDGADRRTYFGTYRGVPVHINRFLRWDHVGVIGGHIFAGSMSGLLTQLERERRRADAVAAFAPELEARDRQLGAWADNDTPCAHGAGFSCTRACWQSRWVPLEHTP